MVGTAEAKGAGEGVPLVVDSTHGWVSAARDVNLRTHLSCQEQREQIVHLGRDQDLNNKSFRIFILKTLLRFIPVYRFCLQIGI